MFQETVKILVNGKVVGWFQGKMEFGPRALGNRSILLDPRSADMQSTLNLKIKYRESFRPFAPSILREYLEEWYDFDQDIPYMMFIANINDNKKTKSVSSNYTGLKKLKSDHTQVPAITHVDYTSRIKTIKKENNYNFYKLIQNFNEKTSRPMLINTSFNVRGEPIVCNPNDAFKCFMGTEMDALVIGNYILEKVNQNQIIIRKNIFFSD